MKLHVVVNYDLCDSYGKCVTGAPEVFHLDENDMLQILDAHPPESLRRRLEGCVKSCPKRAITLEIEDE